MNKQGAKDTPQKTRSRRARRSPASQKHGSRSGPKPRRLDFEEESQDGPAAQEEEAEEPSDVADDSQPESSNARDEDEVDQEQSPGKPTVKSEDADLFKGNFARMKPTPSKSTGSARKRARKASRKSPGAPPVVPQPDAATLEDENGRDEEIMRNDEVVQLLRHIKEDRLVSIIPLDCNPQLVGHYS